MTNTVSKGPDVQPRRQLQLPQGADAPHSRQLSKVLEQIRDDGPAIPAASPLAAPAEVPVNPATAQVIDHPDRERLSRSGGRRHASWSPLEKVLAGLALAATISFCAALGVIYLQHQALDTLQAQVQMLTGTATVGTNWW